MNGSMVHFLSTEKSVPLARDNVSRTLCDSERTHLEVCPPRPLFTSELARVWSIEPVAASTTRRHPPRTRAASFTRPWIVFASPSSRSVTSPCSNFRDVNDRHHDDHRSSLEVVQTTLRGPHFRCEYGASKCMQTSILRPF